MADTSLAAADADENSPQLAFFQENMAAFREHAPHVHARLAEIKTPHSRLTVDDDGALDIAFGDRRFYGEDAVAFTQRQIAAYIANPERRYIDHLDFGFQDGLEQIFEKAMADALTAEGAETENVRVDETSHFTIVFGLGLGLHIGSLIEFTGCAELMIVEPNFDNLYHSLFVIDWSALFDQASQAGCTINLIHDKDQKSIATHLRKLIQSANPSLLDGVYVYQHYPSSMMTEARQAFHRDFALNILGLGFFEDEMLMMANAVVNLKNKGARFLNTTQQPRDEPIFICGSGPSIDPNLDIIAAQRDRALVVSMGSSLRSLLAHGIRPDFHVETENHPVNAEMVKRIAAEFDLSGITLLGASTIQPDVPELFDEVILYFRDSQSPAEIFGRSTEHMSSSGPTVANAALVTLLYLGFRDIYLLGVDMGSRQADNFHSSETYIGRGESKEWAGGPRLPVPANFGGDVVTQSILNWSRAVLENVLNLNPDIRCVNCSDGARIASSVPMLPEVIDLQNQPLDRARVMDDLRTNMPSFSAELLDQIWRDTDLMTVAHEIFAGFDEVLAAAAAIDDPGVNWIYELNDLINQAKAKSAPIGIFLFGTNCLFLGASWWFDGRIDDPLVRRHVRRVAVRELRRLYAEMEKRLSILCVDVGRCLAGEIARIETEFDI
ncbi:MAG: DUF115 domain-containing protein [Alphaproteobacteria bacterium]|nr:DUF115 domain-containing protein [Alphaproteobacteria bacterium]